MPNRDKTGVTGCFHIHVEDGVIKNVFSHMGGEIPKNCVIHLLPEHIYSVDEFKKSHPYDKDEVNIPTKNQIFDLGPKSVVLDNGQIDIKLVYNSENSQKK